MQKSGFIPKIQSDRVLRLLVGPHPDAQGSYSAEHPGFKAVQDKISKSEHISSKEAGAILAASTRHASAKAKKENPDLKHVK